MQDDPAERPRTGFHTSGALHARSKIAVLVSQFDLADKDVLLVANFRTGMNPFERAGPGLVRKRFEFQRDDLTFLDVRDVRFGDRDFDEHVIKRRDLEERLPCFERHTFRFFQVTRDHKSRDRAADFQVLAAVRQQFLPLCHPLHVEL